MTEAALDPGRLAESKGALEKLVFELQARGITILGTEVKRAADPVWVVVKVPREQISAENMAVAHELRRQPAILRSSGFLINYVTILTVEGGEESVNSEFLVDDLLPHEGWSKTTSMSEVDAKTAVDSLAGTAVAQYGQSPQVATTWSDSSDGRFAQVNLSVPTSETDEIGHFLDSLDAGVMALNTDSNAGIVQLELTVRSEDGELLAKEIVDYQLALGTRCVWINPVIDGPDARPGFMK
jgi:hypothetical protein